MNKSNNDKKLSENTFLEHKKNLAKHHKDYLGLEVPENYFSKSKKEIISIVTKEELEKKSIFRLKPIYTYPIAASIVFLIGITIWFQSPNPENNHPITNVEEVDLFYNSGEDFLVSSLLVEDSQVDQFVDDYIINEMIVEADFYERELENIFLNSLIIEDSLIDGYADEKLFDSIIL